MADTTAPTESKTAGPTGGEPATGDPADALGDAGKKALDAERAARREAEKRAAALAAQIKAAEAKNAEALKAAQERIAAYEHRDQVAGWKAAAAKTEGVPVEALRGDTEEEIAAHAKVLKGILGGAPVAGGTGISGKAPDQGAPNAALQAVRNLFGNK